MPDPKTPEEWQNAVDAAKFFLVMETAKECGLVKGGPKVNLERCEDVLRRGQELGFQPAPVEKLIKKFLEPMVA